MKFGTKKNAFVRIGTLLTFFALLMPLFAHGIVAADDQPYIFTDTLASDGTDVKLDMKVERIGMTFLTFDSVVEMKTGPSVPYTDGTLYLNVSLDWRSHKTPDQPAYVDHNRSSLYIGLLSPSSAYNASMQDGGLPFNYECVTSRVFSAVSLSEKNTESGYKLNSLKIGGSDNECKLAISKTLTELFEHGIDYLEK